MIHFIRGLFTPSIGAVLSAFEKVDSALEKLIQHESRVQASSLEKAKKLTARADASAGVVDRATRVRAKVQELVS